MSLRGRIGELQDNRGPWMEHDGSNGQAGGRDGWGINVRERCNAQARLARLAGWAGRGR